MSTKYTIKYSDGEFHLYRRIPLRLRPQGDYSCIRIAAVGAQSGQAASGSTVGAAEKVATQAPPFRVRFSLANPTALTVGYTREGIPIRKKAKDHNHERRTVAVRAGHSHAEKPRSPSRELG